MVLEEGSTFRIIDVDKVDHVSLGTPAVAGLTGPANQLRLYFGGDDPFVISDPAHIEKVLKELDLEGLGEDDA